MKHSNTKFSLAMQTLVMALTLTFSLPLWAEVGEPVGVSCEVRAFGQVILQFSETSKGPWVHAERLFQGGNKTFLLRVEATENDSGWGVLQLKKIETGENKSSYGPTRTREVFRLNESGISVECVHWPYIAG